tara:strand:- start:43 stop:477 length:435 start_codon:yes stop_codon:yes gene_type:complete
MGNGTKANKNGKKLEDLFENLLIKHDIPYQKQVKYTGIYGKQSKMDFYLTDHDVAIEIKNQTGSGSVWEKIPHVMHSLIKFPAKRGVLVCGDINAINESRDSWWKDSGNGAIVWAENFAKSESKDLSVFHFRDIEAFVKSLNHK